MQFKVSYNHIISLVLILTILNIDWIINLQPSYSADKNLKSGISSLKRSIDQKRNAAKQKILELKNRERREVSKLYQSQVHLERTKNDIQHCENKLAEAKGQLASLQSELDAASYEHQRAAAIAGARIRQIYKGERISILHLIFASQDINTFLDRIYYQKRLAVHDKNMLNDLRIKARRLEAAKRSVENQKNTIINTIDIMNNKKRQIASAINTSQYLINKLRTDRLTYESAERELSRQSAALERKLRSSMNSSVGNIRVSAGFIRPIYGSITSPFGWRKHPIFGSRSFHTGVDIAGPNRGAIRASNSGKVIYTGWYGGYGKVVIINHGDYKGSNTSTLYAHMSSTAVKVGSTVNKGDVIGYEGTTGYSTGPHLHFEVRLNGKPTNPLHYIP